MAKTIVILDQPTAGQYRVVLRAVPPLSRQPFYAVTNGKSAYRDPDSPTQASDDASVQSGAITERVMTISVAGRSQAQVSQDLQDQLSAFQADVNARNPWSRYGTFFDGAAWTSVTVA